jgi:hypothetical protein
MRESAAMTVEEVATRAGVDPQWLASIEAGVGTHDVLYSQWLTLVRAMQPPRPEWWDEGHEHDLHLPPGGHHEPRSRRSTTTGSGSSACARAYGSTTDVADPSPIDPDATRGAVPCVLRVLVVGRAIGTDRDTGDLSPKGRRACHACVPIASRPPSMSLDG